MVSRKIDWSEIDCDEWENSGRNALLSVLEDEENPRFKEIAKKLDVLDEENKLKDYYEEQVNSYSEPMMSYGHILETSPSQENILKVVLETNCSVMYNNNEDIYYIVLCGGGMDLSQDIALSYVWLERWIPEDFISRDCKQKNLSVYGENFIYLRNAIIEQTEVYKNRFEQLKEDWTNKE